MNDIFVMSRVLDSIRSPADWSRSSGYAIADCVFGVAKELIDNSLDACEEAGIAPVVGITLDNTGLEVKDTGPGISTETVARFADLATRQSARAYRVGPSRGQQGNGLQTSLVLPFVLDSQCGRAEIISRGYRHEMTLTLNRLAEEPKFAVKTTDSVQKWTSVRLCLPTEYYLSDDSEKARFVRIASTFAWLNPHLHMIVTCFGERHDFPATDPEWKKWTPNGNGPLQWYTEEDFTRLTMETIRHDPTRLISDYMAEFAGLRRKPVQAEVLDATGLHRQSVSALVNGQVECLYAAMLKHGKAVQPDKLGVIGRSRLKTRMAADCDMDTFRHDYVSDFDEDGRPFIVEMALAESDEARVIRGVNWSAMIGDPFPMLDESQHYIFDDQPVTLLVHYVKPSAASMDRGKTRVSVSEKVDGVMNDMLAKLAANWVRKCKTAIRKHDSANRQSMLEEKKEAIEAKQKKKQSLKELIFEVIPEVRDAYYQNFGEEIDSRQFFYNCRYAVKTIDPSKDFTQQTFDKDRKEWEEKYGPIEGLCKKARGVFVEPHSGKRLPLSTRDVRDYIIPDYEYDKILVWEKQGFEPLLTKYEIAQKYDIGMIFNEGLSVDACLALARACADKGIIVFVMHDGDPSGYVIYDVMGRVVECVDLSWTVDECLAAGKVPESDYRRCAKKDGDLHGLPECIIQYLSPAALELFLGEKVRNDGIKKCTRHTPYLWKYGRIELNDMFTDPDWAIAEIERRLLAHGCKKLVPPLAVVKQEALERRQNLLNREATYAIREALDTDGMVDSMVKKLKSKVKLGAIPADLKEWAKKMQPESWSDRIETMIEARIRELDDEITELAEEIVSEK